MCYIVKKGSQEISTVKEFREAFPGVLIVHHYFIKSLADEYCLCQVDMKATLDQAGIKHIFDGSCYTITKQSLKCSACDGSLELTNGLLVEQLQVIAEEFFEDERRTAPKAVIDEVIQILQRRTK